MAQASGLPMKVGPWASTGRSPWEMPAATAAAVRAGVWLRPFRDLVYTMPPYVTTDEELAQICTGVVAAARARR